MSARPKRATATPSLLATGVALLTLAGAAGAQVPASDAGADARWLPFMGCWEGVEPAATEEGREMLCLRPAAGEGGVEFLTVVDGEVVERERRRADGERRPADREGCEGWERVSFSDDGYRVYLRTEYTCQGGVERTTTGLLAMVTPHEWVDVRTVEVRDRRQAWVRRYREAPPGRVEEAGLGGIAAGLDMAVESGRMAAAGAPDLDDVIDASRVVDARAVEAWIAELGDPFRLDAEGLERLADAGVSETVIDVVVAVSYPDRFDLNRGGEVTARTEAYPDRGRGRYGRRGWYGGYHPGYRPFFGHPYSFGLFYSPYRSYAGFGYYRGYRPSVIVVQPRAERPSGRVVNGRGYTRSRSGSGSPSRSVLPGRGSRDGGSVSPAGARQGGGSSSTGRKAKKRGGGGGDGGDGGGDGGLL